MLVNELWPNLTLSLGWTTECCEPFTRSMMEAMLEEIHNVEQPVTFPARAASFRVSKSVKIIGVSPYELNDT